MKIGDKYIIPSGTKLFLIELQQSFITTKKYVIEVTHTIYNNESCFFGDLYEITFEHWGIPGLIKVIYGQTTSDLSIVEPIGNTLDPKILEYTYLK